MIVYLLFNTVNGKYYVGKTKNLEFRWKEHVRFSKDIKCNYLLHRAIRKYRPESFSIEILSKNLSEENANILESLWIITLRSYDPEIGYNMTFGGDGGIVVTPRKGWKHTEIARQKMSAIAIGRVFSEEHKLRLRQAARSRSPDWKRKLSDANKGRKDSDEKRRKQSEAMKGKIPWNKGIKMQKRVINLSN